MWRRITIMFFCLALPGCAIDPQLYSTVAAPAQARSIAQKP